MLTFPPFRSLEVWGQGVGGQGWFLWRPPSLTCRRSPSRRIFSGSCLCACLSSSLLMRTGFPQSSVGKESARNAGDSSSIPGSGRAPGEGIGYPLQYSWVSLVAQLMNLPAMRETWVRSLGWEDPLEKGKATHSSIVAWRIPWTV